MNLMALPAFTDNYIWVLHDGQQAVVVDPGDAQPVLRMLTAQGLTLAGILVTHHHHDHVDGLAELRTHLKGQVYGPALEKLPTAFVSVNDGDKVLIGPWQFEVLFVPGHTAGHVAYYLPEHESSPLVFCGDTLFSGGCGRLFEGTPAQMHQSLQRLAALPAPTRVCCTHEYTLSNMKFARVVEPTNIKIQSHMQWCEVQRQTGQPTLPSSLELEREINPFLRCHRTEVVQSVRAHAGSPLGDGPEGELAVFTVLRQWKNEFRA